MTPRRAARTLLPALALIVVGLTAGCSSGSSSASTDKAPFHLSDQPVPTDHVDLPKSYKFLPRVVEVKQGTTVTWTNHDDFPHTVQILAGADAGTHDLGIGKTVTISFDKPGTVYYHCSLHPSQMQGEVVVTS
ncbi:MAG TPA: plastocyanin/azurin family copper-binding protein [Acidimicrobiia bacterium]|jgi:plastocyanin